MPVEIKKLDARALEDYKTIRLEALQTEPTVFSSNYEEEKAQRDDFHWLRLQLGAVYGAYDGPRIIGMAGVIRYREMKLQHKASIWGVYVSPAWRGQKVARRLMECAIDDLPADISQINIGVEAGNKAAKSLYQSLGFEEYGIEKGAFSHDGRLYHESLMVKFL